MKKCLLMIALVMVLGFVGCYLDKPAIDGGGSSSSSPSVGDVYVTNQVLASDGYYVNGVWKTVLPALAFENV